MNYTDTISIDLRENNLAGTIPSEIGRLQNLVVMNTEGNPGLMGPFPDEICQLEMRKGQGQLRAAFVNCSTVSCEDSCTACICADVTYNGDDEFY